METSNQQDMGTAAVLLELVATLTELPIRDEQKVEAIRVLLAD